MFINIFKITESFDQIIALTDAIKSSSQPEFKKFLEILRSFGFRAVRYYDVTRNVPVNDELITLSAFVGMGGKNLIGYEINFRDTTLGNSVDHNKPVVGKYDDVQESQGKWVNDLSLKGMCWVDVPVTAGGKLVGLLALDWEGEREALTSEDMYLLHLIASRLGMSFSGLTLRSMDTNKLFSTNGKIGKLDDFVKLALIKITESLDAAVGSIFFYDWKTDRLEKVEEYWNSTLGVISPVLFAEEYGNGSFLTGSCWDNDEFRHIVDFKVLRKTKPTLINTPSDERHNAILKHEIKSILYGVIGKHERRYLIRLFNRSDNQDLPFVAYHKAAFDFICRELSELIDIYASSRRLECLQAVSKSLLTSITNPDESIHEIKSGLDEEGVNNFVVLCRPKDSNSIAYRFYSGDIFFAGTRRNIKIDPIGEAELLQYLLEKTEPYVFDLLKATRARKSPLVEVLLKNSYEKVVVFPINTAHLKGDMIIPIPTVNQRGRYPSINALMKYSERACETLSTYASIIGSCIDASQSHSTVEGALRLVGYIGHEVTTPSAILGHTALDAIRKAINASPKANVELIKELEKQRESVKNEMLHLSKTMDVAQMVSPQTGSRIQLNCRKYDLNLILLKAKEHVSNLPPPMDQYNSPRDYEIHLSESCTKLGEVICDPDIILQVFINVIGNAVKYSLPRYKGKAIEIEVMGLPQNQMSIVRVTNWGLGIPPEEQERIFDPFVRGTILDQFKAIRGMGLGLYLAKRIMAAHKGSISVRQSQATLDDPKKLANWEGFETTFEIRLPHVLTLGVQEYFWENNI
ncbi:MAG: GAF domain-containing sensor histidine kinase [Bacteroidota bacterium]